MRILELHLLAFGPFTDLRLDFSAPAPALHVIYGPNEAGKSTALRAIGGLLYGIPHVTPDDHLHRAPDLRVGGRLESAAGVTVKIVRRKGRVKTLFDEADNASDDSLLRPFLGGVGEDLFRTMFGLNHETLRQGAEALLAGRGDVGESLFGAGLGGAGLHQVLTELREEAAALFTPQARVRPLNEAIKALLDAQKRARDAATLPSAWEAQKQQIAEAEAERAAVDAAARDARTQEKRLRRAQRVLPLLEARRTLTAERQALGDVALLPEHAPRDREEALARMADAGAAAARLSRDLAELRTRRDALVIPRALVELTPEAIDDLQDRLGSHRKAIIDLPRVRGELRALEDEARAALRRLGREPQLEQVDALRIDVATEARIKKLAREQGEVEARPREVARLLADRQERHDACVKRLAALPEARDAGPLRRALARAQRQGDLEQRLREAQASARQLAGQAAALRDRLGLLPAEGAREPAAIAALPLPAPETVARFDAERSALGRQRERLAEQGAGARAKLAEIGREIEALQGAGDVLTEGHLVEARGRRDLAFATLMRALGAPRSGARAPAAPTAAALFDAGVRPPAGRKKGGAATATTTAGPSPDRHFLLTPVEEAPRAQPDAYAELVKQADAIADRLRREADRVALLSRLLADRRAAEEALTHLAADQQALAAREAEHEAAWIALWAPAGLAPRSPAEMRGWLARHAALCAGVDRLREAEAQVEVLRQGIEGLAGELALALGGAGAAAGAGAGAGAAAGAGAGAGAGAAAGAGAGADADAGAGAAAGAGAGAGADLTALVEAATHALASRDEAERDRQDLSRQAQSIQREITELSRERAGHDAARAAFRAAWAECVARIGLGPEVSPDEAIAVLDQLAELFRKADEAAHTRRRVMGMERDARQLTTHVAALAAAHAPDLADLPAEQIADTLIKRYHKGHADLAARSALERQIDDKQRALAEAEARRADAEARLERLCAAARAADLEALVLAEARSREARALDRRLAETEAKLLDAGEGSSVAALEQETEGKERDALAVELERTEEHAKELEDRRRQLDRQLGSLEAGRERLRKPMEDAAEAAAEAAGCVARLKAQVDRYVRARLAAVILEREIERYRERNQGPILGRASALFQKLTREAYSGLKVSFDEHDQAVLRCVRPPSGGAAQMGLPGEAGTIALSKEVDVGGLSDGARDQLYLALRLASLEHHARRGEPMPLVLDDILIHFDDDRARAALAALGEMAGCAQILFFTHHARLLELAREAVPAGVLREHRLG